MLFSSYSRYKNRVETEIVVTLYIGIGWSYFGTDPDWGAKQAGQLKRELEAALVNHDVSVVSQIAGSIEIVPKTFHKVYMVVAG